MDWFNVNDTYWIGLNHYDQKEINLDTKKETKEGWQWNDGSQSNYRGDDWKDEITITKTGSTLVAADIVEYHHTKGISTFDSTGDGRVGAFSDGFMVLRKMFGDVFEGEALTNKAITNEATRDTDEINEYITAMSNVDPIS